MKKIFLTVLILFVVICLTGCVEEVKKDTELPVMQISETADGTTVLTQTVDLENGMQVVARYDTGDYDLARWRVTDSKVITMTVSVENVPVGCEVFLEHAHLDMSIKSTHASVDGWAQDSMDDSFHGYSQDGFYVVEYPYKNIFAVQGFSQTLLSMWNGYGSETRLTEGNLRTAGAYANKLQAIYDFIIKYEGEEYFHVISVKNEFLIPLYSESNVDIAPAGTH